MRDYNIEKALYQAPHLLPSIWRRLYGAGARAYFRAIGEIKPLNGITTILGKSLPISEQVEDWLIANGKKRRALLAEFGTAVHKATNDFCMGRDWREGVRPRFRSGVEKAVKAFANALRKYDIKPENILLIETPVYASINGCECVQTIDYLFEIETKHTKKVIVDKPTGEVFKTGKNAGKPKTRKDVEIIETVKKEVVIWDLKSNYTQKEVGEKTYYEPNLFQLLAQKEAVFQTYGIKVDRIFNWSELGYKEDKGDNTFQLVEWVLEGNEFEGSWKHKSYKEVDIENFHLYMRIAKNKKWNIPSGKLQATRYVNDEYGRLTPISSTITYEEFIEDWRQQKENKEIEEEMDSTDTHQLLFIRSTYPEYVSMRAEYYANNDEEWILKGYVRDIPQAEIDRLIGEQEEDCADQELTFRAKKDWFLLVKSL